MYKVIICFDTDNLTSFQTIGKNFNFIGKFDNDIINFNGDSFYIVVESPKITISFYVTDNAKLSDNLTGTEFEFTGQLQEPLQIQGKQFQLIIETNNIKKMNIVPGVICFSFRNEPYDYCLSTTTHYAYNLCENDWLENLKDLVQKLDITHLYVMGKNQKKMIQDYVGNIQIYIWPKPFYLTQICPRCYKYGCAIYKAKNLLSDLFKHVFVKNCE